MPGALLGVSTTSSGDPISHLGNLHNVTLLGAVLALGQRAKSFFWVWSIPLVMVNNIEEEFCHKSLSSHEAEIDSFTLLINAITSASNTAAIFWRSDFLSDSAEVSGDSSVSDHLIWQSPSS